MDTTIYEDMEFTGIFGGINVVTGLNFSGDILLNSDSSLVRILFTDQYNDEFIIHESYPLIVEDTAYSIEIACDETCFIDSLVPYSIKVDIIDAVVDISHFTVDTVYQPGLSQLQYDFKRKYDSLKIIQLNNNIVELGMEWEAGDNSFVEKYYLEKKDIFGEKYNLGGYDYYVGGIFELFWAGPSHYHFSDLVDNFDWRSRHGATDLESYCNDYEESCLGNDPDTMIYMNSYESIPGQSSTEEIQLAIINNGLVNVEYNLNKTETHSVALVGYMVDPEDQSIIWIYKNSYGADHGLGKNGFVYTKTLDINILSSLHYITGDIIIDCDEPHVVACLDLDNDGYCNWGLGEKPLDCNCVYETPDCDDSNPAIGAFDEYYNCSCEITYDPNNPEEITGSVLWDQGEYLAVDHDVIVKEDGRLTISGRAYFAENAKIIVERGGELIIDGGLLTRGCDGYWQGIEVWGDPSESQFNTNDQGFVTIINNGQIEYANVGISTSKKLNGFYIPNFEGGIIQANDASFINNIIDIEFFPYQNMHPYVPGHEVSNFSFFKKCDFLTSLVDIYVYQMPDKHVSMESVKGIRFSGCRFEFINHQYSGLVDTEDAGIGIYSENASVIVESYCDDPVPPTSSGCDNFVQSVFKELRCGIWATNDGEPRVFSVIDSKFIHNFDGIYLSGYHQASILSNEIKIKNNILEDVDFFYGIYLEDCSGYHIEANNIYSDYTGGHGPSNHPSGIYVRKSGTEDNEIYNNLIHHTEGAILAVGQNKEDDKGLCIKCNEMYENMNDVVVYKGTLGDGPLVQYGIKEDQGSADALTYTKAGNTFTIYEYPGNPNLWFLWNYINSYNVEDINYHHHMRQSDPLTYPGDDNYYKYSTIHRFEYPELTYIRADACPPRINNGGTPLKSGVDLSQMIGSAQIQIDEYTSQLEALVDGGDTEDLNWDVMLSLPDEGLEIKQQLMDESPYLSDTVMLQAIYKEDVLPNAMVRDVLTVNPQSAKSDKILEALNDRFVQMPDYMMGEIMEGADYIGAREILEAKLAYWKQERTFFKNELIRSYICDTLIISPVDSLIVLYQNEEDLASQYRLAFCYIKKKETDDAIDIIDAIPGNFALSAFQTAINNDYQDYFDIVKLLEDSSWHARQLDSVQVAGLFDIMDHDYPLISGCVRTMLINGDHLDYTETVTWPVLQTQSYTVYDPGLHESPQLDCIKVFPNPAWDYLILEFNTSEFNSNGQILITDLNGKSVKNLQIPPDHNQITLHIGDLPQGMYNITLFVHDKIIDSEKFTIIR